MVRVGGVSCQSWGSFTDRPQASLNFEKFTDHFESLVKAIVTVRKIHIV